MEVKITIEVSTEELRTLRSILFDILHRYIREGKDGDFINKVSALESDLRKIIL